MPEFVEVRHILCLRCLRSDPPNCDTPSESKVDSHSNMYLSSEWHLVKGELNNSIDGKTQKRDRVPWHTLISSWPPNIFNVFLPRVILSIVFLLKLKLSSFLLSAPDPGDIASISSDCGGRKPSVALLFSLVGKRKPALLEEGKHQGVSGAAIHTQALLGQHHNFYFPTTICQKMQLSF